VVIAAAVAATTILTGIDVPSRASAEVPEMQPCIAQPELIEGSTGPGVLCLQFSLIMLGYSVPYSGTFDRATTDAVTYYQALHPPLVADGRAGLNTLASLGIDGAAPIYRAEATPAAGATASSVAGVGGGVPLAGASACVADATIDPNERGQSVACLQRRLTVLGFYKGSITGLHDQATQDALRTYQKATPPLTADGVGGPRTLAALGIWSGLTVNDGRSTGPGPFPAPMQDEPNWNLTADGIPKYGNRTACTPSEAAVIAAEFAIDGADAATQQWAVYIASREGGCRYEAVNINAKTRDDSHCTFQLNALSGMFGPTAELGRRGWTTTNVKSSLQACADAASDLWVFCGRGPWTPPYNCAPPWSGSTVGQPPPVLPAPPTSVLEEPAPETPIDTTPVAPAATSPPDATSTVTTTTVVPAPTVAPTTTTTGP
jgi:hypothetical protein